MSNNLLIISMFLIITHLKAVAFSPSAIEEFPESTFLIENTNVPPIVLKPNKATRFLASLNKYPDQFRDEIHFWKEIYTKHPEENILIHDKNDLELIYEVLNFSNLKKTSRNLIVYEILKNRSVKRTVLNIKNRIKKCDNSCKKELLQGKDYTTSKLLKNIRTQTGQKNIIEGGLSRLKKVESHIAQLFDITDADQRWIALPFLESSFNEKAISKVNAAGAWQIMPWIGKKLLPYLRGKIDARFNIYLSTLAAIKILKQNVRITKSHEISIIAYNSGLRNFFKTKKKLGKEQISYIEYLSNANSKSLDLHLGIF